MADLAALEDAVDEARENIHAGLLTLGVLPRQLPAGPVIDLPLRIDVLTAAVRMFERARVAEERRAAARVEEADRG